MLFVLFSSLQPQLTFEPPSRRRFLLSFLAHLQPFQSFSMISSVPPLDFSTSIEPTFSFLEDLKVEEPAPSSTRLLPASIFNPESCTSKGYHQINAKNGGHEIYYELYVLLPLLLFLISVSFFSRLLTLNLLSPRCTPSLSFQPRIRTTSYSPHHWPEKYLVRLGQAGSSRLRLRRDGN